MNVGRREITLIDSLEGLQSLAPEWEELADSCARPNVFTTWEWVSSWWDVFRSGFKPWILVARSRPEGTLLGVAPLALRRCPWPGSPCRELVFGGNVFGSADHLDLLCRAECEAEVAADFADCLDAHRGSWDLLRLDGMAARSRLVESLVERKPWTSSVLETVCPFLELPKSYDEYFSRLSRGSRANLRRRAKRLREEAGGHVAFEQVTVREQLGGALRDVFRLHQDLRNAQGQPGAFRRPDVRAFHALLCQRLLASGRLRIYLLYANRQAIAMAYCFRHGDTFLFYQTGYDRNWSRFGPGKAIVGHAIRCAIEEGAREFDFLRGAEAYKSDWTDRARRDLRVRLAAKPHWGAVVRAYRVARAARNACRTWYRRATTNGSTAESGDLFPRILGTDATTIKPIAPPK